MTTQTRLKCARWLLDRMIAGAANLPKRPAQFFWRLIGAIRAQSTLLTPRELSAAPVQHIQTLLQACARIVDHRDRWLRKPETWVAEGDSSFEQFRSLIGHLFARYPVPECMIRVWLHGPEHPWELPLYHHLAAGLSVRQFVFRTAFRLSKQGAVWFMQAPHDLTPSQALRWAQVRSLGGDGWLARLLATKTRLGQLTDDERFWIAAIQFLVRYAPASEEQILEILQFIDLYPLLFTPASIRRVHGPHALLEGPFSFADGTWISLQRYFVTWRAAEAAHRLALLPFRISAVPAGPTLAVWNRTTINPFSVDLAGQRWAIDELLTSHEVHQEAHFMRNCVMTYLPACIRRQVSLWSMKLHVGERPSRVLTIEVCPVSKRIRQFRGKCNSSPSQLVLQVLQEWAAQEGLKLRVSR